MTALGWLTRSLAEAPRGDDWLSGREREVLASLRVDKRRADWRLGRFAAKAAVAAWLCVEPQRVEVLAADDGAPEALLEGEPASIALSISHRGGRALAFVAPAAAVLGCDLEPIEPRSEAFVRDWLGPSEREQYATVPDARRSVVANLAWSGKEAAAKARREGLRLDVRRAAVQPAGVAESAEGWRRLQVEWENGERIAGWWREEQGWLITALADPAPDVPVRLAGRGAIGARERSTDT